MKIEPSIIVLYVDNVAHTSSFYQDLLGITPQEDSPTFHAFKLSNGMGLGLKANHTAEPPSDKKNGHGELAFIVGDNKKVDELFMQWQAKKIEMILTPTTVPYGYTFVAIDPDGNRLRVVSLGQ